ncbi:MAG: LPXTG cell wall anchor domain-containing protein [Pseudomonadota bacterium]
MMKATLDVVLFLLAGIALSAASVAGTVLGACAVTGGGCWWWRRRKRRSGN